MTNRSDSDKWHRIYTSGNHGGPQAAKVLRENTHLLPAGGKALDLACGLGANALLLAQHGLETCAWDISQTAIDQLRLRARALPVLLQAQVRDIITLPPAPGSFDVIIISRFLERTIIPHLIAALRDGGLIYYQTFSKDKIDDSGPRNPDYRLEKNELLSLFQTLQIIYYREEGTLGDISQVFRNETMLIAQRNEVHNR